MKTKQPLRQLFACAMGLFALPFSPSATAQTIHKTDLQQLEGIFQKDDNKDAYVQFTVKNGILTGKKLWDGQEYELVRQSDLEFISKNEEYPVRFIRNDSGNVGKCVLMHRSEWTKVKEYKPREVVQLSPAQLKSLQGRYVFQEDSQFNIQITAGENSLVLKQLWDNKEIVLVPESALSFFSKEQHFPALFKKNGEGNIIQLICFEKDAWDKVE